MYEGVWSQKLEDEVENSIAKPLVEEMFYRFGLKVYGMSKDTYGSFLMTLDGLPYCEVYAEKVFNHKKEVDEIVYCYYSMYYGKERGRDSVDRHTLRSTKLTKLMQTIDKNKALMPDHTSLFNKSIVQNLIDDIKRSMKNPHTRKYIGDVSVEMVQRLLSDALTKTPATEELKVKYKLILDKWNEADENEQRAHDKVRTVLGNEFYAIAETETEGVAIASFKVTKTNDNYNSEYEIIKPFQRVLNIDDYEFIDDIRLPLTMLKLNMETIEISEHRRRQIGMVEQKYYEDIGVIQTYDSYPAGSDYKPVWTIIPTVLTEETA